MQKVSQSASIQLKVIQDSLPSTYSVSEGKSESQVWSECVHKVQNVDHAHLVLVRDVAVVKVFLNAENCLRHGCLG